jgi:hypothetical protein
MISYIVSNLLHLQYLMTQILLFLHFLLFHQLHELKKHLLLLYLHNYNHHQFQKMLFQQNHSV